MKYCANCGNPMADDMRFCQQCGTKFTAPMQEPQSIQQENNQKNIHITTRKGMKIWAIVCAILAGTYLIIGIAVQRMMLMCFGVFSVLSVMFLILSKSPKEAPCLFGKATGIKKKTFVIACIILAYLVAIVLMIPFLLSEHGYDTDGLNKDNLRSTEANSVTNVDSSPNQPDNTTTESSSENTAVLNVAKYANISCEELVTLLGEPDNIEEGVCSGDFEIPCVYYDYNADALMGEVSFVLVNDSVVRFTSYSNYPYTDGEEILSQFGIEKGDNCTEIADTGIALRYRCVTESIDDFWVNLIEDNKFGCLQVTYDMFYYEEWYLPALYTDWVTYPSLVQYAVKSLLKSPSTADFPNFNNWTIANNKFYTIVQSYVDAQNSYGATIRSEFTFIYQTGTSNLVYAVFDGDVVVDNGYVETESLVTQLVKE